MPIGQRKINLNGAGSGSAITVRITPRMPHNEISEILEDGTIKIRLTAPPVDGKANQALIEFLAKTLQVSSSQIDIVAGQTNKNKLITIMGLSADEVNHRIQAKFSSK